MIPSFGHQDMVEYCWNRMAVGVNDPTYLYWDEVKDQEDMMGQDEFLERFLSSRVPDCRIFVMTVIGL